MDLFSQRTKIVVTAVGSLLAMAALDFVTGQELVFSCTYLIPVSITAWYARRRWVVVMAIVSGLMAMAVDVLDGYEYSHPGIMYWNGFTCLVISLVTGYALSRLRQTLAESRSTNEELRRALKRLEASTEEIRQLQDGLQTVCAWSNRIKVGDVWMTPDEFLTTQLGLSLTHGISPEAYDEAARNLLKAG